MRKKKMTAMIRLMITRLGMVVPACNPSTWKAEAGGF
jgi:hypothetical protein